MQPSVVKFRVVLLTPEKAKELAQRFRSAGKVDSKRIRTLSDDMHAGRWLLNGSPIVLTHDGWVLDGRARLLACIEAQRPFLTLIIEGVDAAAFETIDAVRKRTLSDVLSFREIPHGKALGAALRIIWSYQSDNIGTNKAPSAVTLLDVLEARPEIRDSVIPGLRNSPWLPHGIGIALHYLLSTADERKAESFFTELAQPSLAAPGAPTVLLRKLLDETRRQGGRRQTHLLVVAIKAWNAHLLGAPLKILKYDPREKFPKIAGLNDVATSPVQSLPLFAEASAIDGLHAPLDVSIHDVTPELANSLLEANDRNRRIAGGVVDKYAHDMAAGRWLLNGQTIKIGASGRLLDGQHRLEAVKKAGVAFPAILVRGVPDEAFSSLDVGQRRSVADILRDRGETNTMAMASTLRWFWMLEQDQMLAASISPTNGELLELLEAHPEFRGSYKYSALVRDFLASGVAWAQHYRFSRRDKLLADAFFGRLADGIELSTDNPIYRLRERLRKIRALHKVRMAESERVALMTKAWNAYRDGRPMQQLSWRNRGPSREEFPSPG